MQITIGVGECAVSNSTEDVLKTSVGSCVALIAYCPSRQVLGMAHIALPSSTIDPNFAKIKPCHFADTAVMVLLETLQNNYCCNKYDLLIRLCGGADSTRESDTFKIGQRNLFAIDQVLRSYNLVYSVAETGGAWSRTIETEVANGRTKISSYPLEF